MFYITSNQNAMYGRGFFDASGKGWEYNDWENPLVRAELYAMLRWWLDKGVDGVWLDAICFISKDVGWLVLRAEGRG